MIICCICKKKYKRKSYNKNRIKHRYCSKKCKIEGMKLFKIYKICVKCNTKFKANSTSQKYCNKCKTKKCVYCGKYFKIKNSHIKVKCCSETCAKGYNGDLLFKEKYGNSAKYLKDYICIKCGKVFKAWIGKNSLYCSFECRKKFPVIKQCPFCGKDFKVYNKNRKFCSKYCCDTDKIESQKGDKSPLWKGGLTKINFLIRQQARYRKWRMKVFKRDEFKCKLCNIKGGKLNAHHIKSFSKYINDRFKVKNGITLCEKCHRSIKGLSVRKFKEILRKKSSEL